MHSAIYWMSRISSRTATLWRSVLRDLTGLLKNEKRTLREALASWWRSVPTGPSRNRKNSDGILNAYDSNSVTIDEDGTERTFDKKDIALIRLAIEF